MYATITTHLADGIFTITINRPEKLNALNQQVILELGIALQEVYNNQNIKAAIITGAGAKAFVAGADISEFLNKDASAGQELVQKGAELVFDKIENCPKPIVAAVNGFALGGGCELAMACHIRIASENAKFGQPEVNLGLIPGYGGTQRLTQLVGKGKAMELLMTGNMLNAEEAKQLGLVNQITSAELLAETAKKMLETIMAKAPLAIAHIIALTNLAAHTKGFEKEKNGFVQLFVTKDAKEGVTAFLEKRKPFFVGK